MQAHANPSDSLPQIFDTFSLLLHSFFSTSCHKVDVIYDHALLALAGCPVDQPAGGHGLAITVHVLSYRTIKSYGTDRHTDRQTVMEKQSHSLTDWL